MYSFSLKCLYRFRSHFFHRLNDKWEVIVCRLLLHHHCYLPTSIASQYVLLLSGNLTHFAIISTISCWPMSYWHWIESVGSSIIASQFLHDGRQPSHFVLYATKALRIKLTELCLRNPTQLEIQKTSGELNEIHATLVSASWCIRMYIYMLFYVRYVACKNI